MVVLLAEAGAVTLKEIVLDGTKIEANAMTARGPADAVVTVVEFSDFQCPFCSRVLPTFEQVNKAYGDKIRFVFRQFPLESIHPQARKAAEASLCARDQGKFWEMHDAMFADQAGLAVDKLKEKAAKIGLDAAQFASCLDGGKAAAEVTADLGVGQAVGVSGTPSTYVNGRMIDGAVDFAAMSKLIDEGRLPRPRRTLRFVWPPEIEGTLALLTGRPDLAQRFRAEL